MIQLLFNPSPLLSEIVAHFWYSKVDLSGAVLQHYPTPLLQGLTFNFRRLEEHHAYNDKVVTLSKQAYFFGQPTGPREATTHKEGIEILGVKFKPLGIAKVTGINMEHLADQIIAAEDIWGREVELLCDAMQSAHGLAGAIQVLETFLLDKYNKTRLHYRIDQVKDVLSLIEQTHGAITIKELQYQTNITRKTLERAFLNFAGLPPKLYSQIVRFNAAKDGLDKMLASQNLSDWAYDIGYYDGSHFAAAFKRFSGVTPREYIHAAKAAAKADARTQVLELQGE